MMWGGRAASPCLASTVPAAVTQPAAPMTSMMQHRAVVGGHRTDVETHLHHVVAEL